MIKILENGTVAARPNQMYGWPGITRAANGDILVAASERQFHVCPYGREVIMRSTDNGHTWSLPQEVYNSEIDDRDANLTTLADGTIVLSWFSSTAYEKHNNELWPERIARVTDKMREELVGTWFIKSTDHGQTWELKPHRIPVGAHISPTVLSDGSWISIGPDWTPAAFPRPLLVYKSSDRGETWTKVSEITKEGEELNENHVLDLGGSKLTVLLRKCGDCLRQAFSDDYGQTWTTPVVTDMKGFPAQMIRLQNGDILCVYGHRWAPFGIRGVLSHDNAQTWDTANTFTIYEWADTPDIGYPSSIEVAPGEILTVFYCSRRTYPQQPAVLPEGILYTRYRLD